jgi:hypothetical protein
VIVGCGSAKREKELEPGTLRVKRYPAKDLYTSTYFQKKREYAENIGDQWMILSAHHGLIPPEEEIKPYDRSIDDLDDDQLDALAHQVGMTLIEWTNWDLSEGRDVEKIVVLAGQRYLDCLRERDAFSAGVHSRVSYPLQQNNLGGIGEQMAWLDDRIDESDHEQTLIPDGGRNLFEDVENRGVKQPKIPPVSGKSNGNDGSVLDFSRWVSDSPLLNRGLENLNRSNRISERLLEDHPGSSRQKNRHSIDIHIPQAECKLGKPGSQMHQCIRWCVCIPEPPSYFHDWFGSSLIHRDYSVVNLYNRHNPDRASLNKKLQSVEVEIPTGGIGEQMAWLGNRVNEEDHEQTLIPDGGTEPCPECGREMAAVADKCAQCLHGDRDPTLADFGGGQC